MRIDGVSQGQLNISNLSDILSRLNVGDVVRAQVLEIASNELILKLFDGSRIAASSLTEVDAKAGDFVNFTVKEKNDQKLLLETVKTPKMVDPDLDVKKQLITLNLKPDELNLQIAKEMSKQNLPISKDLIDKAVDSLLKFKNLTPDKAVFLVANKVQVNENQISKLTSLVEGKIKIGAEIESLIKELSASSDPQISKNIENLKEFSAHFKDSAQAEKAAPNEKQTPENLVKMINYELKELLPKLAEQLKQPLDLKQILLQIENVIKAGNKNQEDTDEKLLQALKSADLDIEKLPLDAKKEISLLIRELSSRLKQYHKADNSTADVNGKETALEKDSVPKALENSFVKVNKDAHPEDMNVHKLYKDLLSKIETIRENLQQNNTQNNRELMHKLDNLESNIKFISEINNFNSYVQIPLNMNNNNTTGELYVLKRDSRRKKIDPENATMFISLNTENMGQVDSLIGINKKNVSVNMRVEEQSIIDFVKQNHKALYERLQQKGYKLVDFKYRLIEEQASVLNINSLAKKETESNRNSIDFRI
ncbi:MAG: flagellar hook-length control protein FliK [Clostridia bacterium]|nr:flagellar hook-length control protein FliK [Clostridia bacterium]